MSSRAPESSKGEAGLSLADDAVMAEHGIAAIDLNDLGFLVVALFLVVWLGAVAVWKLARWEQS